MHVFDSLAPIFLVIALGFALRRGGFLTESMLQATNRLTYWVGLPTLLFFEIVKDEVNLLNHGDALAVVLLGTLACVLAAWGVAVLLRTPRGSVGTLVQAAFRGNLAFVGLPVVFYSVRGDEPSTSAIAVIILGAMVPVYNVLAVAALLAGRSAGNGSAWRTMPRQMATNPLIIACLAGGLFALSGAPLPNGIARSIEAIGRMALPLALLGIGASLRLEPLRGHLGTASAGALIKVAFAPLAGFALGHLFGLTTEEMLVALVMLATPTAAASYVLADQLGGDRELAAGTVVLSTLLSLASLSAIIALFG